MIGKNCLKTTNVLGAIFLGMITITTVGCTMYSGCFQSNGLPRKAYFVGGGMQIEWVAPTYGTAYFVEEESQRILQTKFLQKGEDFNLTMGLEPGPFQEKFGMPLGDAKFSLYFIPYNEPRKP